MPAPRLSQVVWRHLHSLEAAWDAEAAAEAAAEAGTVTPVTPAGQIGEAAWAAVLAEVVGMRSEVWRALLPLLGGRVQRAGAPPRVNYRQQVQRSTIKLRSL